MKILYILSITCIIVLPCCQKAHIKKDYKQIKQDAYDATQFDIIWQRIDTQSKTQQAIDAEIQHGITENDAVAIALENNQALQSRFEELGIAKTDLQQAGFFTNPRLEAIFRVPTTNKNNQSAIIESHADFTLSDFWQVPLRKKSCTR